MDMLMLFPCLSLTRHCPAGAGSAAVYHSSRFSSSPIDSSACSAWHWSRGGGGAGGGRGFAPFSTHSNARILKPNCRTPYRSPTCPQENGTEDEEDDDNEQDDDHENEENEDSELESSSVEFPESDKSYYSNSSSRSSRQHTGMGLNKRDVNERLNRTGQGVSSMRNGGNLHFFYGSDVRYRNYPKKINPGDNFHATSSLHPSGSVDEDGHLKLQLEKRKSTEGMFQKLREELDVDEKCFPLIEFLSTFGLKQSDFVLIYERHMPCLQINVASAQERLEYLLSVGVKHKDIRKILLRQPQILEYTVENNLKAHVAFLESLGIPESRIGKIVAAAPSMFSYNIELSLKPTVRYLVEEVGIRGSDVSKVVQLSPQILVQRIDNSWNSRLHFLSKELAAPRDSIVKMVTKHPQLLHYSIVDGIQPRINFLRRIGMRNSDIVKVLTNLTQVLSLSLEGNLKPKYLYLVNELQNEVQALTKYPMYFSLSLEQRIRPRHRFLVSLKKAPKGPFPLSYFVPSDESFCQQRAGTSLDKYLAFRQTLLLSDFAKKYERK